jgi:Spy/CpxP family protein refolding chaperone
MNKLRFLTVTVILLLLLNIGTLVYLFISRQSQQGPPGREGAADFIIEQLKLDPAQQKEFAGLRRQHQDIIRNARDEDRKLHDLYFSLLKTDAPDKATIDSVSLLIAEQRKQIESATFDHFQQLRKICRDDQKKLFDATIDEIARRMAPKGPGQGGPGPGGPPPPGR